MSAVNIEIDTATLRALPDRLKPRVLRAATEAVRETARQLEKELEAATDAAGLGKLSKAWASRVYTGPGGKSYEPVGLVYPKGKTRTLGAITAFSKGATILGRRGQYLAIPLPAAGPRQLPGGRGGTMNTPAEWERRTGQKLRPVFRPGKPTLLVLDKGRVNKAGRGVRSRAVKSQRYATIPIFILLPTVTLRSRFSVARIKQPYPRRLAAAMRAKLLGLFDGGA